MAVEHAELLVLRILINFAVLGIVFVRQNDATIGS